MNNWINVNERLPQKEEWYLCYKKSWKKPVVMIWDKKRNDFFMGAYRYPTHWMPLPEIPE